MRTKLFPQLTLTLVALVPAGLTLYADDLPVVKSPLQLRLGEKSKLEWSSPGRSHFDDRMPKGFHVREAVTVAYPEFNPLAVKVKATSKRKPNPDAIATSGLIDQLLAALNLVAPGAKGLSDVIKSNEEAAKDSANKLQESANKVNALTSERSLKFRRFAALIRSSGDTTPTETTHPCTNLPDQLKRLGAFVGAPTFQPKTVTAEIGKWKDKIKNTYDSHLGGPAAVAAGATAVTTTADDWDVKIGQEEKVIKEIQECAETPVPAVESKDPPVAPVPIDLPADLKDAVRSVTLELPPDPVTAEYRTKLEKSIKLEKWLKDNPAYEANQNDIAVYREALEEYKGYLSAKEISLELRVSQLIASAVLIGNPSRRVSDLKAVVLSGRAVAKSLNELASSPAWGKKGAPGEGADYGMLRQLDPTYEEVEEVTVEVIEIAYEADSNTSVISVKEKSTATATFTIDLYSRIKVEPAVGAVFGTVTQPEYGTDTKDGKTVIKRADNSTLSIAPSLMLNFVCGCRSLPIRPLLQVGAATSPKLPGVLVGSGVRLFGNNKRSFGIAGGVMFGWVKDLQTLKIGQEVAGTAAIEADKGYQTKPQIGGYFTLQYQFK